MFLSSATTVMHDGTCRWNQHTCVWQITRGNSWHTWRKDLGTTSTFTGMLMGLESVSDTPASKWESSYIIKTKQAFFFSVVETRCYWAVDISVFWNAFVLKIQVKEQDVKKSISVDERFIVILWEGHVLYSKNIFYTTTTCYSIFFFLQFALKQSCWFFSWIRITNYLKGL